MTASHILKTLTAVALSAAVLTGCSKMSTTSEISTGSDTPTDVTDDINLAPNTGVTSMPEEAQPTLSNSTEVNDLEKDLDATTIKNEDFSDL